MNPPGRPGLVAKAFGLIDPYDTENWPMYSKIIMKDMDRLAAIIQGEEYVEPAKVEAPKVKPVPRTRAYQPSFPVARPGEAAVQSGHAYVLSKGDIAKDKVKTRKETGETANVEEEEWEEELPDTLPLDFKLLKKVWKVKNLLLSITVCPQLTCCRCSPDYWIAMKTRTIIARRKARFNGATLRRSVNYFLNPGFPCTYFPQGMKHIGFDIIQTAGSSVRFNPPVKSARPITFHSVCYSLTLPPGPRLIVV